MNQRKVNLVVSYCTRKSTFKIRGLLSYLKEQSNNRASMLKNVFDAVKTQTSESNISVDMQKEFMDDKNRGNRSRDTFP
jgi:hypothetical protein